MRRHIFTTMAAGMLLAGAVNIANPPSAWALHCDNIGEAERHICLFNDANYEGNLYLLGDLGEGNCNNFEGDPKRSFRNGRKFEGYLYEGTDCTGRSIPAPFNTENPDIGFDAVSFKQACVSCLPGGLGRALQLPPLLR